MRTREEIQIIVAVDEVGGFACKGEIPWNYKEDWEHFKQTTKDAICIMGRKTYEDIWARKPKNTKAKKTLAGRDCYVVTSNPNISDFKGVKGIAPSIAQVLSQIPEEDQRPIFLLGGEKLYLQQITWSNLVHLTIVPGIHNCDRFFPVGFLDMRFTIKEGRRGEDGLMFVTYCRRPDQHETKGHRRGRG